MILKGLLVELIGTDRSAGGATSGKESAVLLLTSAPLFEPTLQRHPGLVLVEEEAGTPGPGFNMVKRASREIEIRRVRAVPVAAEGNDPILGGAFGGRFIWSTDGRFPYSSPIPVFDRFE